MSKKIILNALIISLTFIISSFFFFIHFFGVVLDGILLYYANEIYPKNSISSTIVNWIINLNLSVIFLILYYKAKPNSFASNIFSIMSLFFLFFFFSFLENKQNPMNGEGYLIFLGESLIATLIYIIVSIFKSYKNKI